MRTIQRTAERQRRGNPDPDSWERKTSTTTGRRGDQPLEQPGLIEKKLLFINPVITLL